MIHGLLWLPLLMAFFLIAALGWIERRRQNLYLIWAKGSELAKLDGTGAARLKAGILCWSSFEAGSFKEEATFEVKKLEMVELMALSSGEAPLTKESEGRCRLRLVGSGREIDVPFSDAERARQWMDKLMSRARCDL